MDEGNRALKKSLINLAAKITRYFNHWIFLNVSLVLNVIPNGLKLKKSPQIGRKSEEFSRKWKQIIQNAETDLTRTLLEEYRIAEKSLQLDFWNTMITYLSQDKDLQSIISTLGEIRKNIVSVSETTKGTRVRKMNRLAEGKYEEDLEIALKK